MSLVATVLDLKRPDQDFQASICLCKEHFELDELPDFLHPIEVKNIEEKSNLRRKRSILLGKKCAKTAFGLIDSHQTPESDYYISKGVFEQPIVHIPHENNLQVSISHSKGYGAALCFPEEHPMGIDIEALDKLKERAIETQCTEEEVQKISEVTNQSPYAVLWTVKEALSKCIRTGMYIDFKYIEVSECEEKDGILILRFQHFGQYKAYVFFTEETCCAIVFPYKTEFDLLPFIQEIKF